MDCHPQRAVFPAWEQGIRCAGPDKNRISRRDLIGQCIGGIVGSHLSASWVSAIAAPAQKPFTSLLVNEKILAQQYPKEIDAILAAVEDFCQRENGEVIHAGPKVSPAAIKAQLLRQHRRPERLLMVGDEANIPRFKIKPSPDLDIETNYFYGDLNGDGVAEVPVCRVLGGGSTIVRLLGVFPSVKQPRALMLGAPPHLHLELNRIASSMGGLGCTLQSINHRELKSLAEFDVIILAGHGDPNGWYGATDGNYCTTDTVPDLPLQPVVYAGACSTTPPGSPILRKFLDKGCRVYVGSDSVAFGWTPARNANELLYHFCDALNAHPSIPVATAMSEARARYVAGNGLGAALLKLEAGEPVSIDPVHGYTALQFEVFGDITAPFPHASEHFPFVRHPLAKAPLQLSRNDELALPYHITAKDGVPVLFLHFEWKVGVGTGLELDILQNGQLLHQVNWKKPRDWWEYVAAANGGYRSGQHFEGYVLAPLIRQEGANKVEVKVSQATDSIRLKTDSVLQLWPKRDVEDFRVRQKERPASGINLLLLSKHENFSPLQIALRPIAALQIDHLKDMGELVVPYEFPKLNDSLLDLGRYDTICLGELEWGYRAFPRGMAQRMKKAVQQGRGFIALGGTCTFGTRSSSNCIDFRGTPIEEIMPVRILKRDDAVDEKTKLHGARSHPIFEGVDIASAPAILGFNRTAAKPGALVLLRTSTGDPLLAVSQCGNGRSVAWASNFSRGWCEDLGKWPGFSRLWSNMVRWATPDKSRTAKMQESFADESVFLGNLGGYKTDEGANSTRREDHLSFAQGTALSTVVDNLVWKYTTQFDRQIHEGKRGADRFYGEASVRLASHGADLGDSGSNSREPSTHEKWAHQQTPAKLRETIEDKVRALFLGMS